MIFEKQIVGTFRNNFLRRCDDTGTAFYSSAADFHKPLRSQLAEVIFPVCEEQFLSEFLAESILRWIVEGVPF